MHDLAVYALEFEPTTPRVVPMVSMWFAGQDPVTQRWHWSAMRPSIPRQMRQIVRQLHRSVRPCLFLSSMFGMVPKKTPDDPMGIDGVPEYLSRAYVDGYTESLQLLARGLRADGIDPRALDLYIDMEAGDHAIAPMKKVLNDSGFLPTPPACKYRFVANFGTVPHSAGANFVQEIPGGIDGRTACINTYWVDHVPFDPEKIAEVIRANQWSVAVISEPKYHRDFRANIRLWIEAGCRRFIIFRGDEDSKRPEVCREQDRLTHEAFFGD
ncbi:MAG: hypothetical protein KF699_13005 [Phycisphaeraceae bacterium]|nr:hypothetical protein [Phycisphaeraceae bacterium]